MYNSYIRQCCCLNVLGFAQGYDPAPTEIMFSKHCHVVPLCLGRGREILNLASGLCVLGGFCLGTLVFSCISKSCIVG